MDGGRRAAWQVPVAEAGAQAGTGEQHLMAPASILSSDHPLFGPTSDAPLSAGSFWDSALDHLLLIAPLCFCLPAAFFALVGGVLLG